MTRCVKRENGVVIIHHGFDIFFPAKRVTSPAVKEENLFFPTSPFVGLDDVLSEGNFLMFSCFKKLLLIVLQRDTRRMTKKIEGLSSGLFRTDNGQYV